MGSVILFGVVADQQFAQFRQRREIARRRIGAGSGQVVAEPAE
jgi:hypothetical protein